jgi:gluconate kinase
MIIAINGCFSSGKSTFAQKLAGSIDRCGVVDPDLFASFRPFLPPEEFDIYGFTWDLIEVVLHEMIQKNIHCVMQQVIAPGITSADQHDIEKRLYRVSSAVRFITLFPSLERVKRQNMGRTDVIYPDHILEKCWQVIDDTRNNVENPVVINDSEKVDEIVKRIRNEVDL